MQNRVIFLCKKRIDSYGKPIGLFNSARFMSNALRDLGIEAKLETVIDGNSIDREVSLYDPSHVIIEAFWVTPKKIEELLKLDRHKNRKWIIRCHSKTPFLANEGIAFGWMKDYFKLTKEYNNLYLAGNNKEFTNGINKSLEWGLVYMPNIYSPNICSESYCKWECQWKRECDCKYELEERMLSNDSLNIGCFGAVRPMKNHVIQALAAIELANRKNRKLFFHINASRTEQKGENILKNLRAIFDSTEHELIEHEWLEHKKFLNLIKQMDICMQVSFSESFNIVTADAVSNKIPVVVGQDVDWIPFLFRAKPTCMNDITKKLNRVYYWNIFRTIGISLNKWCLAKYNCRAKRIWLNFICKTTDKY